jgi:hypothetical protein
MPNGNLDIVSLSYVEVDEGPTFYLAKFSLSLPGLGCGVTAVHMTLTFLQPYQAAISSTRVQWPLASPLILTSRRFR